MCLEKDYSEKQDIESVQRMNKVNIATEEMLPTHIISMHVNNNVSLYHYTCVMVFHEP